MTLATTASQAVISMRSYFNPQGPTQQSLLNYSSSDSLTANASATQPVTIPANTTNNVVNLSTLFPSVTLPLFFFLQDTTNPGIGFKVGLTSSGPRFGIGAGLWFAMMGDGTTALPTLYVDNASTSTLYLQAGALTN